MVDHPAPPLAPDQDPAPGFAVGDRVAVAGEVRRTGEEGHLVRFESGYGGWQYAWIKFCNLFRPDR